MHSAEHLRPINLRILDPQSPDGNFVRDANLRAPEPSWRSEDEIRMQVGECAQAITIFQHAPNVRPWTVRIYHEDRRPRASKLWDGQVGRYWYDCGAWLLRSPRACADTFGESCNDAEKQQGNACVSADSNS